MLILCIAAGDVFAEGSRSLYPASYPSGNRAEGARADMDLQGSQFYVNRVRRQTFLYVYAQAGEYILLGSSNIGLASGHGGDINVYDPQDFGLPGNETVPASADFTCSGGRADGNQAGQFFGPGIGEIVTRAEELAGPNSADNSVQVANGYRPCAYLAPATGIYGVLFTPGTGGGAPNGNVGSVPHSSDAVAAWEVAVREAADSVIDQDGRLFTYAFNGYTGGNNRPVFSTLYYVTGDGYRYRQDLQGLDPNGYALYANTFGFLDDNQPLYKTLRGDNFNVSNLPLGVTAQAAEYPIFFSDISPGSAAEAEAERVLAALNIPLVPPSPQISDVSFAGNLGGAVASQGVGGVFSFETSDTVSYQIIISRDGTDFDPANPQNRLLTGIAYSGAHQVDWNGLDNSLQPFPASPTPYRYRAFGRNGEVHFPIIDAENNGIPGSSAVPGGGPVITRLNGANPGDTTVFFDDRGYITQSGQTVGVLNGTLCDPATPTYDPPDAANPPVSLTGVDSSLIPGYRLWENGGNANADCGQGAGWGDAKAVNLWTYFLTPESSRELEIRAFALDVATSVVITDTAEAGGLVQGTFSFANVGTGSADVQYTMQLSPGLAGVSFSNLPGTAAYDSATGEVTFSGFPAALAPGALLDGLIFSYTAPASGVVDVSTGITTSTGVDEVPANNQSAASTGVGNVDVATDITGIPATVAQGETVTGSVLFSNRGTSDAPGVTYSLRIGDGGNRPDAVLFTSLPNGVSASYDSSDGVVSLSGLPGALQIGQVLSLSFSFEAANAGEVIVLSDVATTGLDAVPDNNSAQRNTRVELRAGVAHGVATFGPGVVPVLALALLLLARRGLQRCQQ
ncbi:hypothetical protein F0M18_02800 [Pseudohalioglobus sediminis]|uniref:DUF11 domain-containing protein n=1 Tax=Pseudohalioglobus sediminis TaxID=2606449 RepID=A0A5B0X4Z0_9GAMM|nr:hypothetical protein [Pseudohalioglobus sediminis]KAA1194376.1 hypothetical protein F0M18_02800 [Pseudohalioglobus sediminis]